MFTVISKGYGRHPEMACLKLIFKLDQKTFWCLSLLYFLWL